LHLRILFIGSKSNLQSFESTLRFVTPQHGLPDFFAIQLIKMPLQIGRLDDKESKYGVTAVGAVQLTFDAVRMIFLNLLEGGV
jgi:hypothetical protein